MAGRPSAADLYRRYSESGASGNPEPRSAREAYAQRSEHRRMTDDRLSRPPRPQGRQGGHGPSEQELAEVPEQPATAVMNTEGDMKLPEQPIPEGGNIDEMLMSLGNPEDEAVYDRELEEMKRELELQEKRDAENLKEFQEKAQAEVQQRLARLDEGLKQSFERQMCDMEHRYVSHSRERIESKSTDVLRINKVFREIGRGLGQDWRPVFRIIVKAIPLEQVEKEMRKIERNKPFIQAYKSLATAKDLCGPEFQIFQVVDALKTCNHIELAERTLDILDSNGEELFTLGSLRPIVSTSVELDENGDPATNGTSEKGASGTVNGTGYTGGPLADRKLLLLSKKMGPRWEQLAAILEMSDEDVNDIKETLENADEYQTNFKVLWNWRETAGDRMPEEEAVERLKAAFRELGKPDVAELLSQ